MRTHVSALLLVLATFEAPAAASEVTLAALRDNSLYAEVPNGSNGVGEYLFVGRTAFGNARRALLAFDVAAAVPAGATIQSVRLELHMSMTIVGPTYVSLTRAAQNWGEGSSDAPGEEGQGAPAQPGDATWNQRFFNTQPWANPGGDFAPGGPSASALVDQTGFYNWSSNAALVADVQGWLDTPATNFGWILLGDEFNAPSAKRFGSRQNSIPANRPRLVVHYVIGCPVPSETCTAEPNSTGHIARMGSSGSTSVAGNDFVLTARGAPPGKSGQFLLASTPGFAPLGNGFLCLGPGLQRLAPPVFFDDLGHASYALDLTQPPAASISVGTTWFFQCVFRDPAGGGAGFDTTNALAATFCP